MAQRDKQQLLVYSTGGGFTQEELELAHDHFDTLVLPGLLPGKAVAVGDTWKVPNAVAQEVCLFEGLTEQTLTGKLEEVKDGVAVFSISGTSNGIDQGAHGENDRHRHGQIRSPIEARGRADLDAEGRPRPGPRQPGLGGGGDDDPGPQAVDQPESLSDMALVSVPAEAPPTSLVQLECQDPKGRFSFLYGRDWQITSQTEAHVVLRLMDNGDFVAQATVTPWTPAEKGKHLTPDAFREAMNDTPGWAPEKELQAGEAPSPDDRWIYRISEVGKMDDVEVLQNFYLVAAPGGEQLVVLVTLTPKQAEKLGARDLALVGGIELRGRRTRNDAWTPVSRGRTAVLPTPAPHPLSPPLRPPIPRLRQPPRPHLRRRRRQRHDHAHHVVHAVPLQVGSARDRPRRGVRVVHRQHLQAAHAHVRTGVEHAARFRLRTRPGWRRR